MEKWFSGVVQAMEPAEEAERVAWTAPGVTNVVDNTRHPLAIHDRLCGRASHGSRRVSRSGFQLLSGDRRFGSRGSRPGTEFTPTTPLVSGS